ncbi:DUF4288 domain-containing protein [Streptosporangium sp. NPDC023615]|uniref:DUF4288 domain-containing protein n=1 Tax=Streptosporangium sp. NPDC023615 TaxID=3154794 RepID=UPI00343ABBB1
MTLDARPERNGDSSMPEKQPEGAADRRPYIALLVQRVVVEGGYAPARYTEDTVLIHERSIEDAKRRAEAMGKDEEVSYLNEFGETVTWTFIGVADVRETLYDDLASDTSLYSRSFDDLPRYRDLFAFSSLVPREA